MGRKIKDLTNKTFGKLLVMTKASSNRSGNITWLCKCQCGKEKVLSQDHLCRNKNSVKSCGCAWHRKGKDHAQFGGYGEISGNWWYSHVLRERKQYIREKVSVTIGIKYAWNLFLKQNRKCALSGIPLIINATGNASIDRIDSSKGYVPGNIQWVDKHINFMKRTYSVKFFLDMCKKVVQYNI